jgi:hypothetical protein
MRIILAALLLCAAASARADSIDWRSYSVLASEQRDLAAKSAADEQIALTLAQAQIAWYRTCLADAGCVAWANGRGKLK